MAGSYNFWLVALSFVVAVLASFVAIDLAGRVLAVKGARSAPYWLAGGSLSMGLGIWSMHFIGMLAFKLPLEVSYDIPITLCSMLFAVLASWLALHTVSRERLRPSRLGLAGLVMGTAIAVMHYLGMEAMRMQPRIDFALLPFVLSLLIAISAATLALWIAFRLRAESLLSAIWIKSASALLMGAAITSMHYTGMDAAHFAAGSMSAVSPQTIDSTWLAVSIGALALLLLVATLIISIFFASSPTIRSRLIFLMIGGVVPVALMALVFVINDYRHGRDQLVRSMVVRAQTMMMVVDSELATVESGLKVLATSRPLLANNYKEFYLQAQDVLRELHANAISVSDASGRQIIDTRRPYGEALPSIENPELTQQVFATGKMMLSNGRIGKMSGEPLVTIAVPVFKGDTVAYQISASISPQRLSGFLVRPHLPTDAIGVIFDATGTIVARTHAQARFIGAKGAAGLLQHMRENKQGSTEIRTLEGIRVNAAFSRSPKSQWTVAIGIPTKNLVGDLWQALWWLLLATVILLAIALTLAWKIANGISRPIRALSAPALALGSGEKVTVPPLGLKEADEVGQALTKASNLLSKARYDAHHDALTGLANRALFYEVVTQQLAICQRAQSGLAVLYIDLDGFKAINDNHGHEIGDAVLRAVAVRLQIAIRNSDMAARLGGDEFAVVLIQPGSEGATTVAAKLVDSLGQPYSIGALELVISASIGVSVYADANISSEELMLEADEAMYKAKKSGKGRYVMAEV